jgi:hypothetical protein
LADFEGADYAGWQAAGPAFGDAPQRGAALAPRGYRGHAFASSGQASDSLTGRLLSPRFRVDAPKLSLGFFVAGGADPEKTYVNIIAHSQVLPQSQSFRAAGTGSDAFEFRVLPLAPPFAGRDVCIELVDESTEPGGHLLADHFVLLDEAPATQLEFNDQTDVGVNQLALDLLSGPHATTAEALAQGYQQAVLDALDTWQQTSGWRDDDACRELLAWALAGDSPLADAPLESYLSPTDRAEFDRLQSELASLERACPPSALGLVMSEAVAGNLQVQKRGSPYNLGPEAPRGYVQVLCGDQPPVVAGSGRRELAAWLSAAENPLTPRVIVNRVWQHHFGRGLVATPDDFGAQGEPPTHPELLDYLTKRFIESGWSIKSLHRLLLGTSTYQQASTARADAHELDPDNRLWHRMAAQRLEAECVRDTLLVLGGNLDESLSGPSVPTAPPTSRPGDGDPDAAATEGFQRRTIYLEVRRGAIPRFLTLFDFPKPDGCVGCRSTANVPLQSLNLLNDPFVVAQIRAWGERIGSLEVPVEARISQVFLEGIGRSASAAEQSAAAEFLDAQTARHSAAGESELQARQNAWIDFCHLTVNLAEFLYVR